MPTFYVSVPPLNIFKIFMPGVSSIKLNFPYYQLDYFINFFIPYSWTLPLLNSINVLLGLFTIVILWQKYGFYSAKGIL